MYLHIVMMAFNKQISALTRTQIAQCFRDIPLECEGIERFELVDNQSRTSTRYTHALFSVFSSEQALDTYRASAAHAKMMAELAPYIEEIVVLDSVLGQACGLDACKP